jgi:alpha-tubulin suppressor-like RCC1 family protein
MNVKSFSLLEVAFVLTISGIIISFGMRGCFEILETKKMEKTEATINAYKISLLKSICQKAVSYTHLTLPTIA